MVRGLHDWIIQRLSAVIMVGYIILLFLYFINHDFTFLSWHAFFASLWVKIATLLTLVALLWHAWIGLWTIVTDYLPPILMRGILNLFILMALIVQLIWGVAILWSV